MIPVVDSDTEQVIGFVPGDPAEAIKRRMWELTLPDELREPGRVAFGPPTLRRTVCLPLWRRSVGSVVIVAEDRQQQDLIRSADGFKRFLPSLASSAPQT